MSTLYVPHELIFVMIDSMFDRTEKRLLKKTLGSLMLTNRCLSEYVRIEKGKEVKMAFPEIKTEMRITVDDEYRGSSKYVRSTIDGEVLHGKQISNHKVSYSKSIKPFKMDKTVEKFDNGKLLKETKIYWDKSSTSWEFYDYELGVMISTYSLEGKCVLITVECTHSDTSAEYWSVNFDDGKLKYVAGKTSEREKVCKETMAYLGKVIESGTMTAFGIKRDIFNIFRKN